MMNMSDNETRKNVSTIEEVLIIATMVAQKLPMLREK